MKRELKKYPNVKLVVHRVRQRRSHDVDAGDPGSAPAVPEPQGDHLADHRRESPQRPRCSTPRSTAGKVKLTGLGTPNSLRKYVKDGTINAFELWNPADLGYLAAYAAVNYASGAITGKAGQTFTAGKLGTLQGGGRSRPSCSVRRSCSTRETSTSSTSKSTEWRCRVDPGTSNHWRPHGRQEHMVRS